MSNAAFLSLVFGGILLIAALCAVTVFLRPHQTSFAGAMTVIGLTCAGAVLTRTGSYWWSVGVLALAALAYLVLQLIMRYSLRRIGSH